MCRRSVASILACDRRPRQRCAYGAALLVNYTSDATSNVGSLSLNGASLPFRLEFFGCECSGAAFIDHKPVIEIGCERPFYPQCPHILRWDGRGFNERFLTRHD